MNAQAIWHVSGWNAEIPAQVHVEVMQNAVLLATLQIVSVLLDLQEILSPSALSNKVRILTSVENYMVL